VAAAPDREAPKAFGGGRQEVTAPKVQFVASPPQDGFAVANLGDVPGFVEQKTASAESAIHFWHLNPLPTGSCRPPNKIVTKFF
jgi:hypothetical protein